MADRAVSKHFSWAQCPMPSVKPAAGGENCLISLLANLGQSRL